jgi:hypothetical protein
VTELIASLSERLLFREARMVMVSMKRLLSLACNAAPLWILMLSIAPAVCAQENTGAGLVTGVDVARHTLMLATRAGSKEILVAPTAAIREDHGQALAFSDIRPGDAVAYQIASGSATNLQVARQFWAIPTR